MPTIKETCSCGAQFKLSSVEMEEGMRALRNWRKTHKCVHSGLTEMGDINSSFSSSERVEDTTFPELHIGFRPNEDDDEE